MIPISKLPAWVNAPWFNTVTTLAAVAVCVLEVIEQPWAPVWVRVLTVTLAVFGRAIKPKS